MKSTPSGHRSALWGLVTAFMTASAIGSLPGHGARIDQDFKASYRIGAVYNNFRYVECVMFDGRMILWTDRGPELQPSWTRLLLNGEVDETFDPALGGLVYFRSFSANRLSGLYNSRDPELVWLDDAGRKTDVTFQFDGDEHGRFLPYPGDQHLLFGGFSTVNGVNRDRLARINADGTVDLSFDAGDLDHKIKQVVALADGKILVSGNFDEIGGLKVPGLARLNASGTVDTGFVPDGYTGEGYYSHKPVAVDSEGRILRAYRGSIRRSSPEGQDPEVLVEIESTPADVTGMLPIENGAFLAWGDFRTIGGTDRAHLALIRGDGTVDTGFNANAVLAKGPRPPRPGEVVRLEDGRLVLGQMGIVLMPDGSADPSFQLTDANPGAVQAVAVQSDGSIVSGGVFTLSGSRIRTGLDRLTPAGVSDPAFDPGSGSTVNEIDSIAVGPDDSIWVAGGATGLQSVPGALLARHDADGAVDPAFTLTFSENARVRSVAIDATGRVTFGGQFESVDGQARNGLARLNPDHTLDAGFADGLALTGSEVEVHEVEILSNGDILVAGTFDAWREERRWGLLKLDAEGNLKTDFVPNEALAGRRVTAVAGHDDGTVAVATYNDAGAFLHLLDAQGREIRSMPSAVGGFADVSTATALPDGTTVFCVNAQSQLQGTANYRYRPFLLALSPDGEVSHSLMPEIDAQVVKDMTVTPDGGLVLAGDFVGLDGLDYAGVARLSNLTEGFAPRMGNISTRGRILGGSRDMIAGFVIEGTDKHRIMIRGVGPTLKDFGIQDPVRKPLLKVMGDPDEPPVFEGGYWWLIGSHTVNPDSRIVDMANRVGAFPLTELGPRQTTDLDAAVILDLAPGAYTVQMSDQRNGIGLIEIYDAAGIEADRRIANLSTRGWVGFDHDRLLGGFVVDGGTRRVLVRAIGPALEDFGVTDQVEDPHLLVVRTKTIEEVASNDNWDEDGSGPAIIEASQIVGAFPLQPGSRDAALLLELEPDAYTAIVSGVDRTTGVALVEVYELP